MNLEKINELTRARYGGGQCDNPEQLNSDVQLINQLGYYTLAAAENAFAQ